MSQHDEEIVENNCRSTKVSESPVENTSSESVSLGAQIRADLNAIKAELKQKGNRTQ